MRSRVLSQEQIKEAIRLKNGGKSKRELAIYFGVGQTTIWDNVFSRKPRKKRVLYIKNDTRPMCEGCEIKLTTEINGYIPLNFKVGNLCIGCYFDLHGLKLSDIFDTFR